MPYKFEYFGFEFLKLAFKDAKEDGQEDGRHQIEESKLKAPEKPAMPLPLERSIKEGKNGQSFVKPLKVRTLKTDDIKKI